ncbi:MAG TPA: hypothetical protein VIX63_15825 [Vicinamibacterales bacterium]
MRDRLIASTIVTIVVLLVVAFQPATIAGQSPASGQAIPRAPDGNPDLSGIWQVLNSAAWDIQDHQAQVFPGLPARFAMPGGQGVVEGSELPYQPWALAKKEANYQQRATADPEAQCYLPGVPRITYMGYPFQIVQTARRVTMLYEFVHAFRNIPIDSRHPEGPLEFWLGDSRGRWEGDTFVVDVVHFTDQTWFDRSGNFHSEQLHVVERYTPVSRDHITYEVTIDDPKVFTRPWKMSMPLYRRQERTIQLLEFECYALTFEKPAS